VIREYTTFVGEVKLDVWVVIEDASQAEESDRLFGSFVISDYSKEDAIGCHRTVTHCFVAVTAPPYSDNTDVIR
jgi:hypothetical protein